MNNGSTWQSIENVSIYSPEDDEDIILFNPLSGETHQLSLFAIDVLELSKQPVSIEQIELHISSLYEVQRDQIHEQLLTLVSQLEEFGLIHPN
jgi:PqqD family protein of HPr-rel-A system